ncbi:hypothetical protein JCM18237_02220 [Halorubrum luteum]
MCNSPSALYKHTAAIIYPENNRRKIHWSKIIGACRRTPPRTRIRGWLDAVPTVVRNTPKPIHQTEIIRIVPDGPARMSEETNVDVEVEVEVEVDPDELEADEIEADES